MLPDILTIVSLGILSYTIDIETAPENYYKECIDDKLVKLELLAHHVLNIYAQFGWLSNNKYLLYGYALTPLIVLLHWKTNKNRCILTEDINKKCNIQEDALFRDFWYLIGFKKLRYYDGLHKFYLVLVWLVSLYKLRYYA